MTALQMLTVWGGVAVLCLVGIVFALVMLLRTKNELVGVQVAEGGGKPKLGPQSAHGA